jgi:hypothetical protein
LKLFFYKPDDTKKVLNVKKKYGWEISDSEAKSLSQYVRKDAYASIDAKHKGKAKGQNKEEAAKTNLMKLAKKNMRVNSYESRTSVETIDSKLFWEVQI